MHNRERVAAVLEAGAATDWITLDQVHGASVVRVDRRPAVPPTADAAVTTRAGVALVVTTADCAPIALFAPGALGVVHAGWLGLLRGVVAECVAALRDLAGGPVHAAMGPCIRPERYEFGTEQLQTFVDRFGPDARGVTNWGTPALDLPAVVRRELERAGVDDFEDAQICTYEHSNCFSHRRDGVTGRQALVAVLKP